MKHHEREFDLSTKETHGLEGFIRPDVAVVDIDTEMTGFKALPPGIHAAPDGVLRTRLQQVMSKESGDWWIAAYHNVDVKAP